MIEKPHSPSCDRNKEPILKLLKGVIGPNDQRLLEVGSGTGQHAVSFSPYFPNLKWFPSDILQNHVGIKQWIKDSHAPMVQNPIEYEVGKSTFPKNNFDLVFTANTFHIMSWELDQVLMMQLGENLKKGARFLIYGPFNYNGKFTSESNEAFEKWLKQRDPLSAIREFGEVCQCMEQAGFTLERDYEMPANNRTLLFKKG